MFYLHMHFLRLTCHWIHEPTGASSGGARGAGVLKPLPTTLASMEAPLQILWRKKKEGENFEEEEEGMRGGRRKKERRAPQALDPGSAAALQDK